MCGLSLNIFLYIIFKLRKQNNILAERTYDTQLATNDNEHNVVASATAILYLCSQEKCMAINQSKVFSKSALITWLYKKGVC